MFDIDNFNSAKIHIKTNLGRLVLLNNNKWYESFCPFCNDRNRKHNPSHGHLHISKYTPFVKCFRCEYKNSLYKFLKQIKFNDQSELKQIKSYSGSNNTYLDSFSINREESISENYKDIYNKHREFYNNNNKMYKQILEYTYKRCLSLDLIDFFMYPDIKNNQPCICFKNYFGAELFCRFINNEKMRYKILNNKEYYFFQNMNNIINYKNIFICEGGFDLINTYKFSLNFKNDNTFYISMGGSEYSQTVRRFISNYLVLGNFNIHILFDKNVNNIDNKIKEIKTMANVINPDLNFEFYIPLLTKDISEFIFLKILKQER